MSTEGVESMDLYRPIQVVDQKCKLYTIYALLFFSKLAFPVYKLDDPCCDTINEKIILIFK